MAKIRTAAHLQAALDAEIGWRLSELSNFKAAISASDGLRRTVLTRAAVPIAYSHWEGFVKRAASQYATYLSSTGLHYRDIKPCFVGLEVMELVQSLGVIKRKVFTASQVADEIRAFQDRAVNINLWRHVEEVGNLNYDTFKEIAEFIGIGTANYETKKAFIDEALVIRRNRIAHGEWLEIDLGGVSEIFQEVITLIRSFKTDIENSVTAKTYLA